MKLFSLSSETLMVILAGCFVFLGSAAELMMTILSQLEHGIPKTLEETAIMSDWTLRWTCITGATLGGMLQVGVLSLKKNVEVREVAWTFINSALTGILFAPIVVRYTNMPKDIDILLAVSGIMALCAVNLIPLLQGAWLSFIQGKLGGKDNGT